jgi:V/A-type H+/Na+-transporting ATPase subunit D
MKLKINPTRQELLKIKKRLKTAKSGHSLLKEKLDGLMREFLMGVRELKKTRQILEQKIPVSFSKFFLSNNRIGNQKTEDLISHFPLAEMNLVFHSVMGVRTREGEIKNQQLIEETELSLVSVDNNLYQSRKEMQSIVKVVLEYANLTIKVRLLAEEIEKTRRRVNSLEHIYIPEMERVKKYIFQKLEERERFDRTVILKLKEFIH